MKEKIFWGGVLLLDGALNCFASGAAFATGDIADAVINGALGLVFLTVGGVWFARK